MDEKNLHVTTCNHILWACNIITWMTINFICHWWRKKPITYYSRALGKKSIYIYIYIYIYTKILKGWIKKTNWQQFSNYHIIFIIVYLGSSIWKLIRWPSIKLKIRNDIKTSSTFRIVWWQWTRYLKATMMHVNKKQKRQVKSQQSLFAPVTKIQSIFSRSFRCFPFDKWLNGQSTHRKY